MKPINNFSEVKASEEYMKLVPGGYVAVITKVEDKPEREYLQIEFDIAAGEFAGYYKMLADKFGFWGGHFVRSYKEKALGMFKGFLISVDLSNDTDFTDKVEKGFDEQKLVGKIVGVIMGEEKYDKNNGEVGTRLVVASTKSVDEIKAGNFRIPEIKDKTTKESTTETPVAGFQEVNSDDLPF